MSEDFLHGKQWFFEDPTGIGEPATTVWGLVDVWLGHAVSLNLCWGHIPRPLGRLKIVPPTDTPLLAAG
jgi:hypothetical protein